MHLWDGSVSATDTCFSSSPVSPLIVGLLTDPQLERPVIGGHLSAFTANVLRFMSSNKVTAEAAD